MFFKQSSNLIFELIKFTIIKDIIWINNKINNDGKINLK